MGSLIGPEQRADVRHLAMTLRWPVRGDRWDGHGGRECCGCGLNLWLWSSSFVPIVLVVLNMTGALVMPVRGGEWVVMVLVMSVYEFLVSVDAVVGLICGRFTYHP